MSVKPGDWVRTCRHNHHGKVLFVYPDCPENEIWQKSQRGLSKEELEGEWALIFDPEDISVLVPVSDCEPAEEVPTELFPDQVVIEAFGPTEEEAAQISSSLGEISGGGIVGRLMKILEGDTGE